MFRLVGSCPPVRQVIPSPFLFCPLLRGTVLAVNVAKILQNTYTLEPLNLNQSALPLLPNFINHSSEQLKAGHLLNAGPGAGG